MRFDDWTPDVPMPVRVFCPSSIGNNPPMHPGFFYQGAEWKPAYFVGDTPENGADAAFYSPLSPHLVLIGGTIYKDPFLICDPAYIGSSLGSRP